MLHGRGEELTARRVVCWFSLVLSFRIEAMRPLNSAREISFFILMSCVLSCDFDSPRSCDVPEGVLEQAFAPAVAAILEDGQTPQHASCLAELLESAPPREIAEVEAVLTAHWRDFDEASIALLFGWWAERDPQAALADAVARRGELRPVGVESVVREWTARHPQEAIRVVSEQFESRDNDRYIAAQGVIEGWADPDPESARALLALVEGLPVSKFRNMTIDALAATFIPRFGADATIRIVESTPDEGERNFKIQVFRRFAGVLARSDPQRAVEWSLLHADGPHGRNMRRHIGVRWAWMDGASAMEWARTLEAGPERADVIGRSYANWTRVNEPEALEWMGTRTDQPELEPALEAFLTLWGRDEPRQALALLPLIKLENERRLVIERTMKDWMSKDPEEARKWLENAEIPGNLRRALLREHG